MSSLYVIFTIVPYNEVSNLQAHYNWLPDLVETCSTYMKTKFIVLLTKTPILHIILHYTYLLKHKYTSCIKLWRNFPPPSSEAHLTVLPWKWRQQLLTKRSKKPTKQYGIESHHSNFHRYRHKTLRSRFKTKVLSIDNSSVRLPPCTVCIASNTNHVVIRITCD